MESSRPNILLADGDAESQRVFRSFFERRGWDLAVVPDACHLGEALQGESYDIVIADAGMPGLSPNLLLGQVYQKRPAQALIVIGESPDTDAGVRLLRAGVTDVLTKPVDLTWLERCVEQAMCFRRHDDRERRTYAFVTSERTEMEFSCKELAEIHVISLPIVSRLLDARQLAENEALKLRLAVQEAMLNAWEHGNLELDSKWKEEITKDGVDKFSEVRRARMADPAYAYKKVFLTSYFNGARLEISIKDEGAGFLNVWSNSAPPAQNLSCSGRGMTLMTNAVDEVRFSRNGSEVTLIKYLHTAGS
jgi:DNA-binding response OmpR family regulator